LTFFRPLSRYPVYAKCIKIPRSISQCIQGGYACAKAVRIRNKTKAADDDSHVCEKMPVCVSGRQVGETNSRNRVNVHGAYEHLKEIIQKNQARN